MPVVVHSHPWDVRRRLMSLCGLDPGTLDTAVRTGHVAFLQCTDNDPPFIPGTAAWSRTLRSLREQLLGLGWRKDDAGNYSLTISDTHRVNIVVSSGDEMTGLAHGSGHDGPKSKTPKGVRTEKVVASNVQGDLFPGTLPENIQKRDDVANYDTWVLLIYIKAEQVRAELSRPILMVDGYIAEWSERIILPIDAADPEVTMDAPDDFGPDFDPAVKRIA